VRWGSPTSLWWGLRFYDRREDQGHGCLPRLLVTGRQRQPCAVGAECCAGAASATPHAGLTDALRPAGSGFWEVVQRSERLRSLAGRSAKDCCSSAKLTRGSGRRYPDAPPSELVPTGDEQEYALPGG